MRVNGLFVLLCLSFISLFSIFLISLRSENETLVEDERETAELQNDIDRLRRLIELEQRELQALKNEAHALRAGRNSQHSKQTDNLWREPIAVLVFACNRKEAVRYHVEKLLSYRPSSELFPIIVSQDCDNEQVRETAMSMVPKITYIKHVSGEKANITIPREHNMYSTYYMIARHYKLALDHVFNTLNYTSVIITEDDLDIAPDFFDYFGGTRYLLERDPRLWCVSAWNDNGKMNNIDMGASSTLYRSDFFSGLGWMFSKKLWAELGPIWPVGFWDDWMRDPLRRKDRQCIRPEISRTAMTKQGQQGASKGQFFTKHLAKIVLNTRPINFTNMDLNYLLPDAYETYFNRAVNSSRLMPIEEAVVYLLDKSNSGTSIRVEYDGNLDYIRKADRLHVMHDFKAGVPRTAYNGVVTTFTNGVRVYLVPNRKFVPGYDKTWEVPAAFGE